MTIVRWARHGQSEANVTLTLSHRIHDPDLTDLGRRQAASLADRLASDPLPMAVIACSPLRRARQTADAVATRCGLRVTELEDLRELDVGTMDGRRDDEAWRVYHEVLASWAAGDDTARFPGGESGAELVARVRRAILAAVRLAGGGAPLIVAHGGNIEAAVPALTGEPGPRGGGLPTTGVATFEVSYDGEITMRDWPADGTC